MLGIDRICTEFEYFSNKKPSDRPAERAEANVPVEGLEFSVVDEMRRTLQQRLSPIKRSIREDGRKAGKSKEEIDAEINEKRMKLKDEIEIEFKDKSEFVKNTLVVHDQKTSEIKYEKAYNAADDFKNFVRQASRCGIHLVVHLTSIIDLKQMNIRSDEFRHRLAFQLSVDDSRTLFANKMASTLPEHICMYDDSMERYSFRPYIHKGISWDGWYVSDSGELISPFGDVSK